MWRILSFAVRVVVALSFCLANIGEAGPPWFSTTGKLTRIGTGLAGEGFYLALDVVTTNNNCKLKQSLMLPNGSVVQATCRFEVGGTPQTNPEGYVLRSPTHWTRQIAESGVPLQMWWSTADQVVTDQQHQSGALFREIKRLRKHGRLDSVVGTWAHSHEMRFDTQLPQALVWLGLLPAT